MPTKLDELFFEITVKKGPGADAAVAKLIGSMKQTETATKRATKATDQYTASNARATKSAGGLTRGLKRLVVAFGGILILRKVVGAMTGFETRIAEISTIAGGGAEQVEELEMALLSMTRAIPQSAEELGAGAYQALSSGFSDTADVLDIVEASAKAATAGLTNTETAVDALTTVLNAFSMDASEATRVADILFKTVELGKLKFTDIAQTIGNAATSASLAGVSIEELTAGMATMTKSGIFAAEATTSLNRLFLTLVQQTDQQRTAFKKLGVEFTTTTVAERGFAGLLEEINKLTKGQIDALAELFPNIRAARAAFVLAGDRLDEYKRILEETRNSQVASERAFQKMNKTATNQAKILRNNVMSTFQELGQSILPGVAAAFGGVSIAVRWLTRLAKNLGVNFAVAVQAMRTLSATGAVQIQSLVSAILGSIAGFAERVSDLLSKIGEVPLPGVNALANTLKVVTGGLARGLRNAEESSLTQLATEQERLRVEKELLGFVKEGAAEQRIQIAQEDQYVRALRERREEEAEAERLRAVAERLTAEQQEKRANMETDLLKRVEAATLSAVQIEIAAIKRLKQAYIDEYGELSEEVVKQFEIIEAKAEQALSEETARRQARAFRENVEEELTAIEFNARNIEDAEERQATILREKTTYLRAQLNVAESLLLITEEGTDAYEEMAKVILYIRGLLGDVKKEQKKTSDDTAKDAKQRFRDMQSTISLIKQAADGVIDLARAFGLVNDETAALLKNIEQIGTGAATLAAGIGTGNVPGIIAGGISMLGGIAGAAKNLFGGDEEQKRIYKENTEAIHELAKQLGEFGLKITGSDYAKVATALEEFWKGAAVPWKDERDAVVAALERMGLSLGDLAAVAAELGINFKDATPTVQEIYQLIQAMAEAEITQFAETFKGQMAAVQASFDIFDVSNPIEKLIELQKVFDDPKFGSPALREALAGLDFSTAEGRRQAQKNIETLFNALRAGTLDPGELGGLTGKEFLDALKSIESLLDETVVGTTQDVRQSVQVTELQGNQLLAYQSTLVYRAEERNQLLTAILATMGGTPITAPKVAVAGAIGARIVNVQVGPNSFDIGESGPTRAAADFVDEIAQRLGERLQDQAAVFGDSI